MNTYTYEEIEIGTKANFSSKITQDEINAFSKITGDKNPLHMDLSYAKQTKFQKNVVFGLLVQSYFSTVAGMYLPGKYSLILSVESRFKNPAFCGDEVFVTGEVIKKVDFGKIIVLKVEIKNQEEKILVDGEMKVQVMK